MTPQPPSRSGRPRGGHRDPRRRLFFTRAFSLCGRLGLVALLTALALAPAAPPAAAHDLTLTEADVRITEERFEVTLVADLDALALGVSPAADSALLAERLAGLPPEALDERLERLDELLQRRIRLRFDGEPVSFAVSYPERSDHPREVRGEPSLLGMEAVLTGAVPAGATDFTFFASRAFPPVVLRLLGPGGEVAALRTLQQGAESEPFPLDELPPPRSAGRVFTDYVGLGILHIVPRGLDHILFVLGLFLLTPRWRPLLFQVTAFTLAHTFTLALAATGVWSLDPAWVEPLIALSIAWVAVENILLREVTRVRYAVVFAFGLLHGLGFAGVLLELGLPPGQLAASLVGFNVGVELGQIAVLAAAWLLVGWYRKSEHYRRRVVIPASVLIALVGLYWFVERVMG